MQLGIVGAGRIGGGIARQLAAAGHQVRLSFSRDPAKLESLAAEIGSNASPGTPAEAVEFGDVVVISLPGVSCRTRSSRSARCRARS
jgi:8-hydroxy-5-deazaflavin:NADPH oxidoreductase